ncbi:metal ABC transporter substrate-binding protein [Acidimicrobiia bacterium EGI L10123]|uniref:metal ABC transporter substrate-binding protein n=1 Tax=Salinilacustrithrix flava TaxID=2957203 RepID=UPI003D7C2463|nr:metal ABC transporter substrate-binding protein [Acidimicrobiia bacterium EGI L10123]
MTRPRLLAPLALLLPLALLAGACGGDDDAAGSDGDGDDRLVVVTTVSPITSIAADVIGDLARIQGVVPEGTNSHTFEPSPSVSEVLEGADVVFANGLQLEEPTLALARDVAGDATIVELGDLIVSPDDYLYDFSFPEDEGKPNPHLWTDPTLAKGYARYIADTMSEVDPDNAATYEANRAEFDGIVDELDAALRTALDTVPEDNRKLVTYHDAYAYWARTYGWTVVGAVQPEDFGDPSPRAVADLVDQIRAEGVPAVFGSEVFPSPVLETIAEEAGAEYVADLRDDDLPGEPGDEDHSWLALMRSNYATIVEVLGGDPEALEQLELRRVGPDTADYPQ